MFVFNKMRCDYEKREVIRYRLSFARLSCASGGLWQLIKQVKIIIQGAKIVLDGSCRMDPSKGVVFNGAGSPYNFKEAYNK